MKKLVAVLKKIGKTLLSLFFLYLIFYPGLVLCFSYVTCGSTCNLDYSLVGRHYLTALWILLLLMPVLFHKMQTKCRFVFYALPSCIFLLIYFFIPRGYDTLVGISLEIFIIFICLFVWFKVNGKCFDKKEWKALKIHSVLYALLYFFITISVVAFLDNYTDFLPCPPCSQGTLRLEDSCECVYMNDWDYLNTKKVSQKECAKCSYCEWYEGNCVEQCDENVASFRDHSYRCYSCDTSLGVRANQRECSKCQNRRMEDGECVRSCPNDRPLMSRDGKCHSCDELMKIDARDEKCAVCANRTMNNTRECILTVCPEDAPVRGMNDGCYSCESQEAFFAIEEECAKCENRVRNFDRKCILKTSCPEEAPMFGYGKCYRCDEEESIDLLREECDKCPNRQMHLGGCVLKKIIASDKYEKIVPVKREDKLVPIEDISEFDIQEAKPNQERSIDKNNHDNVGSQQVVQYMLNENNCSGDLPIKNSDGWCVSCQERVINTTEKECMKCPDRYYVGSLCIFKSSEK